MGDQEGSKAMTIYIVACFVLAMGALVAYKQFNDKRTELAGEYVSLAGKFADISAAYSRNIQKYYTMVSTGELEPISKKERDRTHELLAKVAKDIGIEEGTGDADHLDVSSPERDVQEKDGYVEYTVEVELKKVTQREWTVFLHNARAKTFEYAYIREIDVQRENSRYDRMKIVSDVNDDRALWNVTFQFVWFESIEGTR